MNEIIQKLIDYTFKTDWKNVRLTLVNNKDEIISSGVYNSVEYNLNLFSTDIYLSNMSNANIIFNQILDQCKINLDPVFFLYSTVEIFSRYVNIAHNLNYPINIDVVDELIKRCGNDLYITYKSEIFNNNVKYYYETEELDNTVIKNLINEFEIDLKENLLIIKNIDIKIYRNLLLYITWLYDINNNNDLASKYHIKHNELINELILDCEKFVNE